MSKSKKKKYIAPGNASLRKYEEEHQAPENKFNIPKEGWFALVFLSAAFLVLGLLTSSIYYALPALLIILFGDRYGKDYILQDYNDMLEKRKIAMGMAEDLSDDERKNLMQALTQERLRLRREKRDRKKAEKLGISYDDYVQAKYGSQNTETDDSDNNEELPALEAASDNEEDEKA